MSGEEAEQAELQDEDQNENHGNNQKYQSQSALIAPQTIQQWQMNSQNKNSQNEAENKMAIYNHMSEESGLDVQSGQLHLNQDEEGNEYNDEEMNSSESVFHTADDKDQNSQNNQQVQNSLPQKIQSNHDERTVSEIEATAGNKQIIHSNNGAQIIQVQKFQMQNTEEKQAPDKVSDFERNQKNFQRPTVRLGFAEEQFSESSKSNIEMEVDQEQSQQNIDDYDEDNQMSQDITESKQDDQFYKDQNREESYQIQSQSKKSQALDKEYFQENVDMSEDDLENKNLGQEEPELNYSSRQNSEHQQQKRKISAPASERFYAQFDQKSKLSVSKRSLDSKQRISRISVNVESVDSDFEKQSQKLSQRESSQRRSRQSRRSSRMSSNNKQSHLSENISFSKEKNSEKIQNDLKSEQISKKSSRGRQSYNQRRDEIKSQNSAQQYKQSQPSQMLEDSEKQETIKDQQSELSRISEKEKSETSNENKFVDQENVSLDLEDQEQNQNQNCVIDIEQNFTQNQEESEKEVQSEEIEKDSIEESDLKVKKDTSMENDSVSNEENSNQVFENQDLEINVEEAIEGSQGQSKNSNREADKSSHRFNSDYYNYEDSNESAQNKEEQIENEASQEELQNLSQKNVTKNDQNEDASEEIENTIEEQQPDVQMIHDRDQIVNRLEIQDEDGEEDQDYIPNCTGEDISSSQIDSDDLTSEELNVGDQNNTQNQDLIHQEFINSQPSIQRLLIPKLSLPQVQDIKNKQVLDATKQKCISPRKTRAQRLQEKDKSYEKNINQDKKKSLDKNKSQENKNQKKIEKFTIIRRPRQQQQLIEQEDKNLRQYNPKQQQQKHQQIIQKPVVVLQKQNIVEMKRKNQISEEAEKIEDVIDKRIVLKAIKMNKKSNEIPKSSSKEKEKTAKKSPIKQKQIVLEKPEEKKIMKSVFQEKRKAERNFPQKKPASPTLGAYQNIQKMIKVQSFKIKPRQLKFQKAQKFFEQKRQLRSRIENKKDQIQEKTQDQQIQEKTQDKQILKQPLSIIEKKQKIIVKKEQKEIKIKKKIRKVELNLPKLRNQKKEEAQKKLTQSGKVSVDKKSVKEEQFKGPLFGFIDLSETPQHSPRKKIKTPSPKTKTKKLILGKRAQIQTKKFRTLLQFSPRKLRNQKVTQNEFTTNVQDNLKQKTLDENQVRAKILSKQIKKQKDETSFLKTEGISASKNKEKKFIFPSYVQSSKISPKKSTIEKDHQIQKDHHKQRLNLRVIGVNKQRPKVEKKEDLKSQNKKEFVLQPIGRREKKVSDKQSLKASVHKSTPVPQSEYIKTRNVPKLDYASLSLGYVKKQKQKDVDDKQNGQKTVFGFGFF